MLPPSKSFGKSMRYPPFQINCDGSLPTLRTSEPPKSTKRYSVPEIKDRQNFLQIIWEGKTKWYEIMSMFPTESAAESNT